MVRVVVASDKFKGSLTSAQVAAAVEAGVRRVHPGATVVAVPVADGGDGTLAAAVAAGYTLVPVVASGPTGLPVRSGYARRGDTAVVELADVCGLVRLPGVLAPMTTSSFGVGELIGAAVDAGCTRVILGIGGSASTDGGLGLIQALTRVLPARALPGAQALDVAVLRGRLDGVQVVVACDVDNPLTGPRGAAAVYGPQKGASPQQVAELDVRLAEWADRVAAMTGRDLRDVPGAGAAGGVGFAALALLGAELRPGIELVLEMVRFREQLVGADLVITGEGALDEQTLHGKAVAGIAAAAAAVPVVAVCGVNELTPAQLTAVGVRAAYALTDLEPDVSRCIAEPIPLLEKLAQQLASEHLTMAGTGEGSA
ncbi:glycerate kinase [Kribbella albertanoniae]|uniref:Glycerate kinase n=1 Tax=Kribbella albertanoniae TaxID=1266829 RepID=A0A4R4PJ63_9ACTN|nr:glycerate kinase [Kribbella albertanoniae]TDC21976.1 glycerate kinase [Kribbella albertanoniae]